MTILRDSEEPSSERGRCLADSPFSASRASAARKTTKATSRTWTKGTEAGLDRYHARTSSASEQACDEGMRTMPASCREVPTYTFARATPVESREASLETYRVE